MKKTLILLAITLSIVLVPFAAVSAVGNDTISLNIVIDDSDDNEVIVVVPNDSSYASLKPEISVNTNFSKVSVKKDGTNVDYELNNGVVTFTIDDYNCTYVIANEASTGGGSGYKAPKTCID